jgi:exonuclease III
LAKVHSKPDLHIGVVHVPLDEYMPGFWKEYRSSLLNMAREWKLGPSLFLGDMNSAISDLDEETTYSLGYKDSFMFPMEDLGWRDMFRVFHPHVDAPTYVSSSGNGFRIDQTFVNPALQSYLTACSYDWGDSDRHGKLSDHAAILLDLDLRD